MKKNILAMSMLVMAAGQVDAGCNLPNIQGTWGMTISGQAAGLSFNGQCAMTIPLVRGNATQAFVAGGCLDLVNGNYSSFLPGSWVGFIGKTCQLQGQLVTSVSVSAAPGSAVLGTLSTALIDQVLK